MLTSISFPQSHDAVWNIVSHTVSPTYHCATSNVVFPTVTKLLSRAWGIKSCGCPFLPNVSPRWQFAIWLHHVSANNWPSVRGSFICLTHMPCMTIYVKVKVGVTRALAVQSPHEPNPGLSLMPTQDDVIKWKHFPRYWPFVRVFTGHQWIPRSKSSDAEPWCFLWSAPE